MKLKPEPIDATKEDSFEDDVLNRRESAIILTDLISTISDPFVLAIDSPWGTGKTTFLQMWLPYLRKQDYPCLYFNAWENDYTEDPLVSLLGELDANLPDIAKHSVSLNGVIEAASSLVKVGGSNVIKNLSAGFVDIKGAVEDGDKTKTHHPGKKAIEQYIEDKQSIQKFKDSLSSFVNEVSNADSYSSKPLLFFIDELDRCRPTYAVSLLERAKHFFNIDGIIFVLAMDKKQISHSIKTLYGVGMDDTGYLRRFIDLDYYLPEPDIDRFIDALDSKFGLSEYIRSTLENIATDDIKSMFVKLFKLFNLDLRTIEQCISQFNIAIRIKPLLIENIEYHTLILLLILKTTDIDLYRKYSTGKDCSVTTAKSTSHEVIDFFESKERSFFFGFHYSRIIKHIIQFAYLTRTDLEKIMNDLDEAVIEEEKASDDERAQYYAVRDLIDSRRRYKEMLIRVLFKKIEITGQFHTP